MKTSKLILRSKLSKVFITSLVLTVMMASTVLAQNVKVLVPYIVNGVNTHEYPTTAALLYNHLGSIDEDNAKVICSATLIGCQTVLTAAHCVIDDTNPNSYMVYLQHAGLFEVDSIAVHPDYQNHLPTGDVAVLKLSSSVTGIAPTPINEIDPTSFIPHQGSIVGFGITNWADNNAGIKRQGKVQTADCTLVPFASENIDFETPHLGEATSVTYGSYVDPNFGITFTAEPNGAGDEVVGLVVNKGTSVCVEPVDKNQKLGTGRLGIPGSVGKAGFGIKATFPDPLPAGYDYAVSVEFQTIAGTPVRLRLFDTSGNELAAEEELAQPASGTCGNPGDPRAKTTVAAISQSPIAYAIMDVPEPMTGMIVFVIDNFAFEARFSDNTNHICWHFEDPVGMPGEDSTTCKGDSGGPLFLDLGEGIVVAGVTTAGINKCSAKEFSIDANVFNFREFISNELGEDSTMTCGELHSVESDFVTVVGHSGVLDYSNTSDKLTIPVEEQIDVLRIALNGEKTGDFNVDFYVKHGPGASETNFDCKSDGGSVFGTCEFESPDVGDWSVYVKQTSGSGEYQVTATLFGVNMLPPDQSCQSNCGGNAGSCWCDELCVQYGDCCQDYESICSSGNHPAPMPNSCVGACGNYAGMCWCDEACTQYGDCCSDYKAVCFN